jgi:Domain of unknown function (DUF4132)
MDAKSRAKDEKLMRAHLQVFRDAVPDSLKDVMRANPEAVLHGYAGSLKDTAAGREILAADADHRAAIAALAMELWPESGGDSYGRVASELFRSNSSDWTSARLVRAVEAAAVLRRDHKAFAGFDRFPHKPLISAVEKAVGREPLSPELRAALKRWKDAVSPRDLTRAEERELGKAETVIDDDARPWSESSKAFETFERLQRIRTPLKDERKLIERLTVLLGGGTGPGEKQGPAVRVDASDAVGALMAADLAAGRRASGPGWGTLLTHARSLSATRPSSKWSSDAAGFAAKIEPEKFGACVSDWLNEAGKPGPKTLTINHVSNNTLLNDCTVDLLKGLAWTIVAAKRADLAPALGNLAEACYKKIPDRGPRNVKVANAATAALAALADPAAAAQLSRLRLRVKHSSSRSAVDKALNAASENTGLSPDDLAEMSVPAFGLDRKGARRIEFGDTYAEVRVANAREVELNWFARSGKACASVPAIVRTKHADELKRLKREVKDASTMLAAQALRLERSFIAERNWPVKVWRERFLDHPLLGTLTRRLIWQFDDRLAVPHGKELLNVTDRAITPKDSAAVSLWHPMRSTSDDVLAWRNWLERHEITQPFKQAHREIYVLTDAERRTDTYSNRFAAHILRQHQLAALCQSRGWDYHVQGQFDSHNVPTLSLPAQNLKAEFYVAAIECEATPRGIYLYVASDQARFGRPLKDVPPVIFSEVMRDVDLFVGIASVASDPTWQDGGPGGRYREYWNRWGFGALSEGARNRRTILERLVPRLADAKRFKLIDKFLVVRGQLRTYKIHLGSGNILMEPNDQYLCIVADRARNRANTTWLPFEGDATLSLILSKALMLAADDQITDQTITRQINS